MSAVTEQAYAGAGRPEATSHAEIEQAAFRLFAERGFERTTLDAIADEVGVGRRTLFRYYPSKNDIPWGQFDRTLDGLPRRSSTAMPDGPAAARGGAPRRSGVQRLPRRTPSRRTATGCG